jgi:hypothetical protein
VQDFRSSGNGNTKDRNSDILPAEGYTMASNGGFDIIIGSNHVAVWLNAPTFDLNVDHQTPGRAGFHQAQPNFPVISDLHVGA